MNFMSIYVNIYNWTSLICKFFLNDKYKGFLVQTKLDFKKGLYIRMKEKIKIWKY